MKRHVADLASLAMDTQMLDTASFVNVSDLQLTEFFTAQTVIEQRRENGPIHSGWV